MKMRHARKRRPRARRWRERVKLVARDVGMNAMFDHMLKRALSDPTYLAGAPAKTP